MLDSQEEISREWELGQRRKKRFPGLREKTLPMGAFGPKLRENSPIGAFLPGISLVMRLFLRSFNAACSAWCAAAAAFPEKTIHFENRVKLRFYPCIHKTVILIQYHEYSLVKTVSSLHYLFNTVLSIRFSLYSMLDRVSPTKHYLASTRASPFRYPATCCFFFLKKEHLNRIVFFTKVIQIFDKEDTLLKSLYHNFLQEQRLVKSQKRPIEKKVFISMTSKIFLFAI